MEFGPKLILIIIIMVLQLVMSLKIGKQNRVLGELIVVLQFLLLPKLLIQQLRLWLEHL